MDTAPPKEQPGQAGLLVYDQLPAIPGPSREERPYRWAEGSLGTEEGIADSRREPPPLVLANDSDTDEALSDADSNKSWRSGRASILPPVGRFGVQSRGTGVPYALYETVLGIADSRNRHRVALEEERTRAAKELVRVERAHARKLAEIGSLTGDRLAETQHLIAGLRGLVEGIQKWLNFEMDAPIKTIGSIHLELQRVMAGRLPHHGLEGDAGGDSRVPQTLNSIRTPGPDPDLLSLGSKMQGLANQFRALQVDIERWRLEMDEMTRGRAGAECFRGEPAMPESDCTRGKMEDITQQLKQLQEAVVERHQALSPPFPPEDARGACLLTEGPAMDLLRSIRSEISEVRDLILIEPRAPGTVTDLGGELASSETRDAVRSAIGPLESKLDDLAGRTSEIGETVRTYAGVLRSPPNPRQQSGPHGGRPGPYTDSEDQDLVRPHCGVHQSTPLRWGRHRRTEEGRGRRLSRSRGEGTQKTKEGQGGLRDAIRAPNTGLPAVEA
ncbi:unnamed protein product [Arctia plantaginis]|uniref:Uncharacterized protein n=1 Tax=Arctia plantaginis TaxID=874455 RepID=A0A8S1B3L5_ARCPL|nr:unnamed protein product [Arctia plantaginis]